MYGFVTFLYVMILCLWFLYKLADIVDVSIIHASAVEDCFLE